MGTPKQVEEAARIAEELMQKQSADPDPQVAVAKEAAEAAVKEAADKAEAEAKAAAEAKANTDTLDLNVMLPEPDKKGDFEAKYHVLQGKYDAEVAPLYKQISDLKVQLADLQAQLVTKPSANAAAGDIPKALEYLRKEMPEFEEAVNYLAAQKAKDILAQQMGDVNTRVDTLSSKLVENTAASFYRYLDEHVSNWKRINEHPAFASWLQGVDPMTGLPKATLLQDSYNKFDGPRAAIFFETFLTEAKGKQKGKSPADKFMAPDAGGGSEDDVTPAPAAAVSRADIAVFYQALARGDYKHNPEAMKQKEAEINKAIAEGKVA